MVGPPVQGVAESQPSHPLRGRQRLWRDGRRGGGSHLIPLLNDDDLQVQLAAITALGKVGGPLAKRALRRCLKKEDPVMEDAARAALENIGAVEDPLAFNYEA